MGITVAVASHLLFSQNNFQNCSAINEDSKQNEMFPQDNRKNYISLNNTVNLVMQK